MISYLKSSPTLFRQQIWLALSLGIPLSLIVAGLNILVLLLVYDQALSLILGGAYSGIIATCLGSAVASAIQGAFFRLPRSLLAPWIGSTVLGWMAAYTLQYLFYRVYSSTGVLPSLPELTLGVWMGLCVGLAQWLFLRRYTLWAVIWIAGTMFWWAFGWAALTIIFNALGGIAM